MIDLPVPKLNEENEIALETGSYRLSGHPIQARVKRGLTVPHLSNAINRHLSLKNIENSNSDKEFGDYFEPIRADWYSCILSCAAGAETYLNSVMDNNKIAEEEWKEFRSKNQKERTKGFLKGHFDTIINWGDSPYNDIGGLFQLRNAILHYRPQFDDEHTLSRDLEVALPKLRHNRHASEHDSFFPFKCLSSAYSEWAITSVLSYIKEIDELTGENAYEKHYSRFERKL